MLENMGVHYLISRHTMTTLTHTGHYVSSLAVHIVGQWCLDFMASQTVYGRAYAK